MIHAVDEAAVVQLAHEAAVENVIELDLADARIADLHQPLYVAHSFQRRMRSFFETAARQ